MKIRLKIFGIIGVFLFVLFANSIDVEAKDTKKPTLTLSVSTKQFTNKAVKVTVKATDSSGIKNVKWQTGKKSTNYFATKGKELKLKKSSVTVTMKKNGTYTFYALDKAGNKTVKNITISNIDTSAPLVSTKKNITTATNKNVKINISATDAGSGVSSVKFLKGKKTIKQVASTGKDIVLNNNSGSITATSNANYSILVTDQAGNQTLLIERVTNIDKIAPNLSLSYSVMNQLATITMVTSDNVSGIKNISYVKGTVDDTKSVVWSTKAKDVSNKYSFDVKSSGIYSVMVTDSAGNQTIKQIDVSMELRAVWISYLEFKKTGYTKEKFIEYVEEMFDNCVSLNMNAVIVQVRPFSDALYESKYFPWSTYVSGKQGKNPGYDPLKIMVEEAHERDLEIHAWINPYRISQDSDYKNLSDKNPAKKWLEDENKANDRNVLTFSKQMYYNPAIPAVRGLIVNGVKEIVQNYDVDGIHFDDYFYPSLGDKYKTNFDSIEYSTYLKQCKDQNKTPMTIENWRRNNVNILIRNVYREIKAIKPSVRFGVSPAGNIGNLMSKSGNYVDVQTWLSSSDYIDYICPQIYWTFTSKNGCPFAETVDRWLSLRTSDTVNMYIGIATYRAGSNIEKEWETSDDVLKRQIEYSRDTGFVDGFMFFRYEHFFKSTTKKEVNNLISVLK